MADDWQTIDAPPASLARPLPVDDDWKTVGTGKAESFARGAFQGATFGYGDELTGIAEYLLTGKPYAKGRDESRASNDIARESNPITYGVGDVAGGVATAFVPGLGIAKGATMAGRIGKATALGAAAGVGYSDAQDAGQLFVDAAKGGGLGAVGGFATEGVGRLIRNAPKRADNRLMQGITEGARPTTADKLVGEAGKRRPDVLDFVREDPALAKAARSGDADKLTGAIGANTKRLHDARDIFYNQVDKTGEHIDPADALGRVMAVRSKLELHPSTIGQADALGSVENEIARAWNHKPSITARELREEVTRLQTEARSYYRAAQTGGVAPEAAAAKKQAADALRDLLHEHVETVAVKHGLPGVDTLRDLNKKLSIAADIEDAASTKAMREAKVPPHRLGWMADVAMGVTEPVALVAKKVLVDSGLTREAATIADDVLAAWVRAAEQGARGAQLRTVAAQLGIGAAAADALNLWAQDKFGQPAQPPP